MKIEEKDLKIPLIIGITGHRDIQIEDIPKLKEKLREIYQHIKNEYPSTPLILLSPLADGADRLAVNIALEDEFKQDITISVPLPFDEDIYKNTFAGGLEDITEVDSIQEYETLMKKIEQQEDKYCPKQIPMLFEKEKYLSSSVDEQRTIRREQYQIVGEYIAIHSHILIAMYDESSKEELGGTKEVVRKKLSGEYQFFRTSSTDVNYPEKGLVYSVATSRRKNENLTNPFVIKQHFTEDKYQNGLEKHDENRFDISHDNIEKFNKELSLHTDEIISKVKQDVEKEGIREHVIKDFQLQKNLILRRTSAYLADRVHKNTLDNTQKYILGLIFITVSIITLKTELPTMWFSKYLELMYPILAWIVWLILKKFHCIKKLQEDYRALSEGLRVQTAWKMAGINDSVALYYLAHQKNELDWIRTALRSVNVFYLPKKQQTISTLNIPLVMNYWVDEQIKYFKNNKTKPIEKEEEYRVVRWLIATILVVPFVLGIVQVCFTETIKPFIEQNIIGNLTWESGIIIVLLVVPLTLIAYLKSRQYFEANDDLAREYKLSLDTFKRAKQLLEQNDIDAQEVYKNLGIEALRENSSWIITRRTKQYSVPE